MDKNPEIQERYYDQFFEKFDYVVLGGQHHIKVDVHFFAPTAATAGLFCPYSFHSSVENTAER